MRRNQWKKLITYVQSHETDQQVVGNHYRAWHDYRYTLAVAGPDQSAMWGLALALFVCGWFGLFHFEEMGQLLTSLFLLGSLALLLIIARRHIHSVWKAEAEFRQFHPLAPLLFPKPA